MKRSTWVVWLLFWTIFFAFAGFFCLKPVRGQAIDSAIYVKNFSSQANNVGGLVAAALGSCKPAPIPCYLVIDPSLAAWAPGTLPTLPANTYLMDYRNGTPIGLPPYVAVSPTLPYPYPFATLHGDSLSKGNEDQSGITVETVLASITGLTVNNNGIFGQTSSDICSRMTAACPSTFTLTSSLGTSSGSTATFTIASGSILAYRPCYNNLAANFVNGYLSGIPGYCVDNMTGGVAGVSYTFTSTAASSGLATGNYTWEGNAGTLENGLNIIWACTNNLTRPQTCLADIATMVASLPAGSDYLIVSPLVVNYVDGWMGNQIDNAAIAIDYQLKLDYPGHFLDARKLLVGSANFGSTLDVTDYMHDETPHSMKATYNVGTLSGSLNSTSCSISTSGGTINNMLAGFDVNLDSEEIYVITASGGAVTSCIRGYGQTTAASHSSGVAVISTDGVHLAGATGDTLLAGWISNWMAGTAGVGTHYLAPANVVNQYNVATNAIQQDDLSTRYVWQNIYGNTTNDKHGFSALGSNYSGVGDAAYGAYAQFSSISGSYNASCGTNSLYYNLLSNNTACGYGAGEYDSTSAQNQNSYDSVYLGGGTGPKTNGDFDEAVLSFNSFGSGTHTATLGSSTEVPYLPQAAPASGGPDCLQIATTGAVSNTGSACASTSLSYWATANLYNTGATFAFTQNKEVYSAYDIGAPIVANYVLLRNVAADNTSNDYSWTLYNSSGNIVLTTSAVPGTTFAPTAGAVTPQTLTTAGTIPGGRYYASLTTNCASSCATFAQNNASYQMPLLNHQGATTSGGAPNSTISPPGDTFTVATGPWFELHK